MAHARSVAIVGGGAFGLAAAETLAARGDRVVVLEAGGIPCEDASGTDINKAVRADYGRDRFHTDLAVEAIERWRARNRAWGATVFHESGFLVMTRGAMEPGGFEHDSYETLRARDSTLERLRDTALSPRFPAWSAPGWNDGYFNPLGGFAESGNAVTHMARDAEAAGAELRTHARVVALTGTSRVTGVALEDGTRVSADEVVVAAGAWSAALLPELSGALRCVPQTVLHFAPADPAPFAEEHFPTWAGDISRTGYYGFPATADGVVKVGRHLAGEAVDASASPGADPGAEALARAFLATAIPALADAPLARPPRMCRYCDTPDGDFWIGAVRPGATVASGGSGHGFKFAPVLGPIVAAALDGRDHPALERFAPRAIPKSGLVYEQARCVTPGSDEGT